MGQEIASSHFQHSDFDEFLKRLREETSILESWFRNGCFAHSEHTGGLELEAWLVDKQGFPLPLNRKFLERLGNPLVVPELASFNVEFNSHPERLSGSGLRRLLNELEDNWRQADAVAAELGAQLLMIGTLPTLKRTMLTLQQMSALERYRALNEQILQMRGGAPLQLDIQGKDRILLQHDDVMLESATTSLQIHLQVSLPEAAAAFNLSKIISAPMVAVCANSPFLFGHDLWAETRIPVFEQAVSVGGSDYSKRVTFGIRYAESSVMECFHANLERYPVILPMLHDEAPERLCHLRLHNGSIWRWTRPLIGFENDGDKAHIRIEHRGVPAGPTIIDSIANIAFFFGLMYGLSAGFSVGRRKIEKQQPFATAQQNFYKAARYGLDAKLNWNGKNTTVTPLVLERLLPAAYEGLRFLQVDEDDIRFFLGIIAARVKTGQNGTAWQRQWVACHGMDISGLVQTYLQRQKQGLPVHEWDYRC